MRSDEGNTYSLFLAIDNAASKPKLVARHDQVEIFGDAHRARYIQRRPSFRYIANRAIDGSAAELNRSGL
jgi:hypothetical protein